MKNLILVMTVAFSGHAMAVSECAGRSSDGSLVMVHINTAGPTGVPDQGEVSIEKGGNKFGYRFSRNEISQFFEYDDVAAGSSVVGLSAYVGKDSPISVKYVGPNFVDQDLKAVIDGGKANALTGGIMRVWKGPGYKPTDQYQVSKPACSVWSNL